MSDQREIYERDREDPYYEGRHTHRKEGFFERNCDEAWEQVKETFSHPGRLLLRVERLLEAVRVGIGGLLAGFRCKFVVVESFRHIENLLSAHPCGACGSFVFVPSAYCTNLK